MSSVKFPLPLFDSKSNDYSLLNTAKPKKIQNDNLNNKTQLLAQNKITSPLNAQPPPHSVESKSIPIANNASTSKLATQILLGGHRIANQPLPSIPGESQSKRRALRKSVSLPAVKSSKVETKATEDVKPFLNESSSEKTHKRSLTASPILQADSPIPTQIATLPVSNLEISTKFIVDEFYSSRKELLFLFKEKKDLKTLTTLRSIHSLVLLTAKDSKVGDINKKLDEINKSLDEIIKKTPEQADQLKELKEKYNKEISTLLADAKEFHEISRNVQLQSTINNLQSSLPDLVSGIERGYNSASYIKNIENFTKHLHATLEEMEFQVDRAIFEPHKAALTKKLKVFQELNREIGHLYADKKEESIRFMADPVMGPKAKTNDVISLLRDGNFPAIVNFIKLKTLEKLQQGKEIASEKISKAVIQFGNAESNAAVQKAANFLFSHYENINLQIIGNPPNQKILLKCAGTKTMELKLSDWLNADLSKINISPDQLNRYPDILQNQEITCKPSLGGLGLGKKLETRFLKREKEYMASNKNFKGVSSIEYSEKLALNIYSQNEGCRLINNIQRGFLNGMAVTEIKEGLLHALVTSKALSKLPDYTDNTGFLWRMENEAFKDFGTLDKLISDFDNGVTLQVMNGLTSASYTRPSNTFSSSRSTAAICIRNANGKNINPWSNSHKKVDVNEFAREKDKGVSEREIIFPKGVLRIIGYTTVKLEKQEEDKQNYSLEEGQEFTLIMAEFLTQEEVAKLILNP